MKYSQIKELIKQANIIEIDKTIYFCIHGKWTVKIRINEDNQEHWVHYNGVYITNTYTYGDEVKTHLKNNISLKEYIQKT